MWRTVYLEMTFCLSKAWGTESEDVAYKILWGMAGGKYSMLRTETIKNFFFSTAPLKSLTKNKNFVKT